MGEVLEKLVSINTVNDLENRKYLDYVKTYLRDYNFEFKEIGDNPAVLIATRGNPKIGFICHSDTVEPMGIWNSDPFSLTISNLSYYGLGVSDMKGGTAALFESISKVSKDIPCIIVFTYDEEINFKGINELVKSNVSLPSTLVFPEPTDLYPVIANKGCIEFKVIFKGVSAHSSTPDLGDNALYKAISFIQDIRDFYNELKEEKLDIFEVSNTTFNLSKINGGNLINAVPDYCEITFDFRTIKKEHNDLIIEKVNDIAEKYKAEVYLLNNLNATLNKDKEMIKYLEELTKKEALGLNYVTEASFFQDKNILILGPGPVTAHETNENISIDSYKKCQDLYIELLEKYK